MGVLDVLVNLKENKWGGQIKRQGYRVSQNYNDNTVCPIIIQMKPIGGNSVTRQIVQTNFNIVHMNKDIVDMSN